MKENYRSKMASRVITGLESSYLAEPVCHQTSGSERSPFY